MSGAPVLHVYVLSASHVPNRVRNITNVMRWIKAQCDAVKIVPKFHSLGQPTADDIGALIQSKHPELEPRIQAFPLANSHPAYAKVERPLNTAEISNYERHRTALKAIADSSPDDFHLVIEDDLYIVPAFEPHWTAFFTALKSWTPQDVPWVLFGVVPSGAAPDDTFKCLPYTRLPLTEQQPLLPSKEMYLIHPSLATTLYTAMHAIQYDARTTFSRWILENPAMHSQIFIPSHRLGFDGSKLGLFPSTIHANNLLLFNQEFMELLQCLSQPPDKKNKANIQRIYKAIERLESPDAQHLYAVLMYQIGELEEAESFFKKAIDTMIAQKGYLSRASEMLHNAIEFYKHYQKEEVAEFTARSSKYKDTFLPHAASSGCSPSTTSSSTGAGAGAASSSSSESSK